MAEKNNSSSNKNTFLVVLLVVAALAIGYLFSEVQSMKKESAGGGNNVADQQPDQVMPTRPTSLEIAKPDPKKDPWKGTGNEQYAFVEYSDLECPFCKSGHPTATRIVEESEGKIAYVWRHFPLSFHQKALPAATAAECAAELGNKDAFFDMIDAIFEGMPNIEVSTFADLAVEFGINKTDFEECVESDKFEKKIQAQFDEGSNAGVAATPTFVFYNMKTGKNLLIEGALPYEQMNEQVQEFIES